jgi:REP element-mobilizing transposase RayT
MPLGIGARRRLPDFDYSNPNVVFFVTICALPDTSPFTDDRLAQAAVASLHWLRASRGMRIYAYCLVPDHLHLLLQLSPGSKVLGDLLGDMKKFTTRQFWTLGHRGYLWQDRFYDHVLRASEDASPIAEYILQNPVRKGLVGDAHLYRWSGLPDAMV